MSHDIEHRQVEITTDDGCLLHGDLAMPALPIAAASILHPHPRMGGDRHSPVVDALFRALPERRIAAVRPDFRGVGRSSGSFGGGMAERLDAAAALELLTAVTPEVPLWSIGYSFGGDVALSVDRADLTGWVAVAPPLAVVSSDPPSRPPAGEDHRPTVLVVPAHDQFNPPAAARATTADWSETLVIDVPMADHFLAGRLDAVVDLVLAAITEPRHLQG
jgi:uncharacterized protein